MPALFKSVAFSPDGQRWRRGVDKTVKIGMRDRQVAVSLKGHAGRSMGVAFNPDGQRLASGSR